MENTHLANLLLTLTTKEFKLLKKWVASPFFNQRTDVIQLLDYYLVHRKKYQKVPTKSQIFNQLFPNEAYDDHKIRMVISFLNRQTEQFLVYQKQQAKKIKNKLDLLRIYRERALEKPYQRTIREIEKIFGQTPLRDANYYRLQYHFYQEQYKHDALVNRHEVKNSLQAILDNLDLSFLIEKIRDSVSAMDHERMTIEKYDLGLYEKLIESLKESPYFLKHPTIAIYHAAHLVVLNQETRSLFDDFYALLEANHTLFPQEELFVLYNFATNYLASRYTRGEANCLIELFPVYKKQIALGLYDKKMPHYAFKNIVSVSLNCNDYDWTEQFIEAYTPKLTKEHQIYMPNLGRASLAWRRGKHEDALALLASTKFEDVIHNMSARMIATKIYYELEQWDILQNHLKAFEVYIRRHNAGSHKEYHLEMVLFAQKILRLNPYDKVAKEKLIQTLEKKDKILEQKWLLEWLNNI